MVRKIEDYYIKMFHIKILIMRNNQHKQFSKKLIFK